MKNIFSNIFDYIKSYWLFLLPHHLFSRFTYIITRTKHPLTHFLISFYIKLFNVNMSECERELVKEYNTFCDFFTRKLKTGVHKIDKSKNSIVSSCDGKMLEFGEIKNHSILQVKNKEITINELLGFDNLLNKNYEYGSYMTIYLSPRDYHRVHMPLKGKLNKMIHVPGRLFSVASHAVKKINKLYSRNERVISHFKNDEVMFSVILVAAINVSSIEVSWKGEVSPPFPKKIISTNYSKKKIELDIGEELGMFKSGSTVILLFNNKIKLSKDLKKGKLIRVGNKIGETIN